MHDFRYIEDQLFCESVAVEKLAEKHGTPLYVYSQRSIARQFQALDAALAPLHHAICYAVKANSNLAVLRTLATLGSGFDVVSEGELRRVNAAGGDPWRCLFAGVGKTEAEIALGLQFKIFSFNVESEAELDRINRIAGQMNVVAPIALRVNPNVNAHTHAKITTGLDRNKFGIPLEEVEGLYARAAKMKHLRLRGLEMHLGSQITSVKPFEQAVRKLAPLVARLKARHGLEFFSLGGGLGIVYESALASGTQEWWQSPAAQKVLTPGRFAETLIPLLQPLELFILVEPGRFLVGNAGILVTRVEYVKPTGRKHFVVVDAGMNDLVRPAMYDAHHEIVPLVRKAGPELSCDVVGPICESGDVFCEDRRLPQVSEGDYLAVMSAGAYGFSMASNYNSRPLPAEVLVHGRVAALTHFRQALQRIWESEKIPRWLKYVRLPGPKVELP